MCDRHAASVEEMRSLANACPILIGATTRKSRDSRVVAKKDVEMREGVLRGFS